MATISNTLQTTYSCSRRSSRHLSSSLFPARQESRTRTRRRSPLHIVAETGDTENLRIPRQPPKSSSDDLAPSFWLSAEEALETQLQALKNNNNPRHDYGIEVLYRFAEIDPWQRSHYFGVSLDLGKESFSFSLLR